LKEIILKETKQKLFAMTYISENNNSILCSDLVDIYELPKLKYEAIENEN
jgi:hypothetical protein